MDRFAVNRNDHLTLVRPHPISVALPERPDDDVSPERNRAEILSRLGPDILFFGVGVDRIDYTKGILERFRGIECFLEKFPHYREQFTFAQFRHFTASPYGQKIIFSFCTINIARFIQRECF